MMIISLKEIPSSQLQKKKKQREREKGTKGRHLSGPT